MLKRVLMLAVFTAWLPLTAHALTADHRLGGEAVPTSESVTLDLDPRLDAYSGSVRIEIRVPAATDSFQLHARDLQLTRVELDKSSKPVPLSYSADSHGVLTIRTESPLTPDDYLLEIEFTNRFGTRAEGLYRLESGGEAYAFTQLEATEARGAFPCWDEPEYKIPWTLTLEVPGDQLAVSNMPIASEAVIGEKRRVAFRRTPPMPAYLVAIAAGPLETVPIPGMSVPGRVITVKGAGGLTGEAMAWTPKILTALERYFGRRFPYPKLDLLAVPEFWPGAMENAGAVTFADRILLLDPATVTAEQRRRLISITAHELAHQWFGDLVTMRWWDDLWLNESFASWMGDKISDQVAPELEVPIDAIRDRQRAMVMDAYSSAPAIRRPADGRENVIQYANPLTYDKGQAVLEMIEQWIGPAVFRRGVQRYLSDHAWGNAEGADLWGALSKAAHRDVAGPTRSFLEQPGVPLVRVERGPGVAQVRLSQSRFFSGGESGSAARWQIPVTLEYSDGVETRRRTVLLEDTEQVVTLESIGSIVWLYPNAGERGYYRWQLDAGMLLTLPTIAARDLTPRERVGLVGNVAALLDGGQVRGDEAFRLFERFARDPHPKVVLAVVGALERARPALVTPQVAPAFAGWVRHNFAPALRRIGADPAAGESDAARILRPRLMLWLGRYGRDPRVLARGRSLAASYLEDPSSVDPSVADAALELAAIQGDRSLLEAYERRFETAALATERQRFLTALCGFEDSTLVAEVLRYTLRGPLRPQDFSAVVHLLGQREENADQLLDWAIDHYSALASRIPTSSLHRLVRAAGTCSRERFEKARAFFSDPAHRAPGADQDLERLSDQVDECAALRQRDGGSVARYLDGIAANE